MTYLRSIIVIVLAVLALAGPSVAAGVRAVTDESRIGIAAAGEQHVPLSRPCERHGKRVLPCHPDLGVLVPALIEVPAAATRMPAPVAEPMRRMPLPRTELPPPRLA